MGSVLGLGGRCMHAVCICFIWCYVMYLLCTLLPPAGKLLGKLRLRAAMMKGNSH